ncbi:FAD/NAD(P)-binding domain-containing protein [Roridomyces roridus]|uniref:FAD/NAD(P)-binding domain-containing protein n=1 Tax=Roridomyces roridus TaxID=1738132 RepID=A0AAD7CHY3_9AGAR|nr:FAD/NAD(P)-binding domain-containing protein [Roridomyces roridus]
MQPQVTPPRPSPLKVSVVGAGLGGLTAALGLRRSGHSVQIFEASQIKTETAAGLGIQTNPLRVLRAFGFSKDNLECNANEGVTVFDAETGLGSAHPWSGHKNVHDLELRSVMCHRSDLHDELKRLAMGEGRGLPVQLHLDSKAVACEPESGTITLANGETIAADLVIAADGLHSTSRTSIVGYPVNPPLSGYTCFRFLLDASSLPDIADLAWLTDSGVPGPRAIFWKTKSLKLLFVYPVRNGALINVAAFFEDADQLESGKPGTATREEVLEIFRDAQPKFLRIMDLPLVGPIAKWPLRAVPVLPTWIRGRAALLGDAAHGTLPLLGQGAAMAIEDAGVLSALLPFGTKAEDIPARLEAYQELRKARGEFINIESIEQATVPQKRGFFSRCE